MPRLRVALVGAVVTAFMATAAPALAQTEDTPAREAPSQGSPPQESPPQGSPAAADPASPDVGDQARARELQAAFDAGAKASTEGPADVTLIDQGVLKLPDGYAFIPREEGDRILRAFGNTASGPSFIGLVVSPSADWIITIRYIKDGYVKDDDARNWNADELLQTIKEGTEAANADRAERGFPQLEVLRWIEAPTWDSETHRLIWSLLAKEKGQPDATASTVNYNTYALGRDGYFSLNLLTTSQTVATDKEAARDMLEALSYNSGKRYEDFNASTDHIAEYGLLALIGGVAAKKLGLFAIIAAFVLKFAKVIAVAAFAGGASLWNFLRRRVKG